MKTIKTALLALGILSIPIGTAVARGHDHGADRGPGRGSYAGAPRSEGFLRGQPRYEPAPRSYAPEAYAPRAYAPRSYAPRGYAPTPYDQPYAPGPRGGRNPYAPAYAPAPQSFRRGQYLPHAYWSGEIADPRGRHLRTPPPGYGWVGVGPNAYLMQRSTGLVLDSVPGAW